MFAIGWQAQFASRCPPQPSPIRRNAVAHIRAPVSGIDHHIAGGTRVLSVSSQFCLRRPVSSRCLLNSFKVLLVSRACQLIMPCFLLQGCSFSEGLQPAQTRRCSELGCNRSIQCKAVAAPEGESPCFQCRCCSTGCLIGSPWEVMLPSVELGWF